MPYSKKTYDYLLAQIEHAPKRNHDKIRKVAQLYRKSQNISTPAVMKMVVQLTNPTAMVMKGNAGEIVDKLYHAFLTKYSDSTKYPEDALRDLKPQDQKQERLDRIKGVKRDFSLHVILLTQKQKLDDRSGAIEVHEDYLPLPEVAKRSKEAKALKGKLKKVKGLSQFWAGHLDVQAPNDIVLRESKAEIVVKRGTKWFKHLYPICMTDTNFAKREADVPGYLEAIILISYHEKRKASAEGVDPKRSRKRASSEKVAIQFRYCSHVLDTTKPTFREALRRGEHREHECWINALFDAYGKKLLRPNKIQNLITRETILKLLGRTEEDIKDGLTIEEVLPFFEKYKLKLRVYDVFYNLIFKYDPEVLNNNNPPLYCVADGDHIYVLDKDLESIAQKTEDGEDYKVVANSNFHIADKPAQKADHRLIEHIDELLEILRTAPGDEEKLIHVIQKQDNLEAIVWQLYEAGFRPNIKYATGKIAWINLTVNDCTFVIRSQQLIDWAIDGSLEVESADVFNRMLDAKNEFYYQVFKAEHRSYYTPKDLEILEECRTVANVGWLSRLEGVSLSIRQRPPTIPKSSLVEIDITKAYTAAFFRIDAIPVFNEFDTWEPRDPTEPLRDLSLYLVEAFEFDLFFNKRYNLCYGLFLKQLPKGSWKVRGVKHPSLVKKVEYKRLIKELWKADISENFEEDQVLKKTIANCCFGMLEKQTNRAQKSKLFDTYEDAKYFQTKYGGTITEIREYEDHPVVQFKTSILDIDVDEAELLPHREFKATGKTLYILNIAAEATLTNGYRYIKELLMQHHNFYLNNSYKLLKQNNISVYSVKTDALTLRRSQLDLVEELLNWSRDIGGWRISKSKDINFPQAGPLLNLRPNKLFEITAHETEEIPLTVEQEYDTDQICRYFEERKRVMIRAEYAGCGKSYACEAMKERGHTVLFVCPTNKLASNYGYHGCTINKFFGIGLTEESKMHRFDDGPYDTIVFDEIFFSSVRKLARIKRYCDEHPEKIIVATGDTNQLESIDLITNQHDYDKYYNKCIDLIFPIHMFFQENKRLRTRADKERLRRFKQEIFDESIPTATTIKKYFRLTRETKTLDNIAYRNSTCQSVSNYVRSEILKKSSDYEVGEILVCRQWLKLKKVVFNVNYEYSITAVGDTSITLNGETTLPLEVVKKSFMHNYCRTCHSFQGSTIKDKAITIYDWKFFHVNRKWLYTAITRATDLSKVYFFDYDEAKQEEQEMLDYLQKKVDRYKQQDRKAKRAISEENYITKEWLASCVGKSCNSCGDCLTYSKCNGKVDCNLTAQRVNNEECHHLENLVAYCVYCNTSVSNRE